MRVRASLLRRCAPALAVLALGAPVPAHAIGNAPDPRPDATLLRPDPVPASAPPAEPRGLAPVVRDEEPVTTPVAPAPTIVEQQPPAAPAARPAAARRHVVRARPHPRRPLHRKRPAPAPFELPPIVLPRLLLEPLQGRSAASWAGLAALALGAAALTAASGAGLVLSWSRR
jgi:hypothetical protein